MNRKTINKIIIKKHNKFLESIKDENVKKLISENSIITGGAITSMLLNEEVNDYDYYFTNKETCIEVAKYFASEFLKANPNAKIAPKIIVKDGRVKIEIKSAGIAAEGEEKSPYQYFESRPLEEGEEYVGNVINIIEEADEIDCESIESLAKESYRPVFMTSNAITLSDKVQLVIRFYGDPEEIHKNYDFIHCTNYWTSKDKKLTLNLEAIESTLSKHLYYCGSQYPLCSVIRTRKFIKRGWHINAGQYLKMCFQVSELDLTDIDTLEEQLVGVDNAYFYQIIEYFKKKQSEDENYKIELPYLVSIVDRIF